MHADRDPALVAEMRVDIAGALAYRKLDNGLHIVALATDPMWQRSGVGGYLVAEAELLARREGLTRVITSTSNDNLPSLYFFQRHGYRLTEIIADAFAAHLKGQSGRAQWDLKAQRGIRHPKVFLENFSLPQTNGQVIFRIYQG